MTAVKACMIAFSLYSRIPMPNFAWGEREKDYHLFFFPWVGALIGGLLLLWERVAAHFGVGETARVLFGTAIPLLVTGGFHVDGFMDTVDAFRSYRSREEKCRIMEDPHVGAFAVITLAAAGLLYAGSYAQIGGAGLNVFALCFVFSRCLSAVAALTFPAAKDTGMLRGIASVGEKRRPVLLALLFVEAGICAAGMLYQDLCLGFGVLLTMLLVFLYYRKKSEKELGGITGDLAGYFVTVAEIGAALVLAVMTVLRLAG